MDDWSLQLVRGFDRIALAFATADSLDALTRCAEEAIDQLGQVEHVVIYWVDPQDERLRPWVVRGFAQAPDGSTALDRLAGLVFASGRRLHIPDVMMSSEVDPSEGSDEHEGLRSLLCLPVRSHERMVGTFALGHPLPGAFDDVQVTGLSFVTKLAAVAYEQLLRVGRLQVQQDVLAEQLEELRRAQDELRLTRFAIDRAGDGIFLFGPDARFAYVNSSACERLGYSREELLGRTVHDVDMVLPPERWPRHWERIKDERQLSFESRMRARSGETFPADVTCNYFEYGDEEYGVAFVRDASQRKQLHAQLAQADRMASIGTLAAGVAHEINNPLTYALTNAEELRDRLGRMAAAPVEGDAAQVGRLAVLAEAAADCADGVRRACDIVRDLRTFSHVDTDAVAPVKVAHVVETALRMASQELKHSARVERDLDPEARVVGNEGRLSQVFLNLLVNAAHAMGDGDPAGNLVTVRVWEDEGEVVAEIEDTGHGMSAAQLSRVFEPFFTTKPVGVGVGLGLWVSHNIVRSAGGRIEVTSTEGVGTRFRVLLPAFASSGSELPPARDTPTHLDPKSRARILVVDDEARVGASLRAMLSPEHDVVVTTSAAEARAALEQDDHFDLVLCDLMMPGTGGPELFEWLRVHHPTVAPRVAFMSAGAFARRTRGFLESTALPYLEKPFDVARVRALVARALARR